MPTLILTDAQCQGRIRRLAYQIWEANVASDRLSLVGIAGQGAAIATALAAELERLQAFRLQVGTVQLDKRNPFESQARLLGIEAGDLAQGPLVLVDDVLNTGRTLAYAFCALLRHHPPRIQVAVLVARHHRQYPLAPDFVGHSISTTLEEHIEVRVGEGVYLS